MFSEQLRLSVFICVHLWPNLFFPEQLGVGAAHIVGVDLGGVAGSAGIEIIPGNVADGRGQRAWSADGGDQFAVVWRARSGARLRSFTTTSGITSSSRLL